MTNAGLIEAINAGGNVGILFVGMAVMDIRGKMTDLRRRLDRLEEKRK